MKVNPLELGPCPICGIQIIDVKKKKQLPEYSEVKFIFTDGSNAIFSMCRDCRSELPKKEAEKIVQRQIASWGEDIEKQMRWYSRTAVHLRLKSWEVHD